MPLIYARDLQHSVSPYLGHRVAEQYPPFVQVLFTPFAFLIRRPLDIAVPVTVCRHFFGSSVVSACSPPWRVSHHAPCSHGAVDHTLRLISRSWERHRHRCWTCRVVDLGLEIRKGILCAVFLVGAIALKAYPAALLVVPLALRRYRFTALVAGSAVVVNLLVLAVFPGGISTTSGLLCLPWRSSPALRSNCPVGASTRSFRRRLG